MRGREDYFRGTVACCRLYTTDMYSDVTCKGSLAHSLNRFFFFAKPHVNASTNTYVCRYDYVFLFFFLLIIYIAYAEHNVVELRGLARWLTTVYPYIYVYIMRYIRFFCILYFLLVGYFIRPEPQTSTLFFSLIYPILINTDEFSYISYREEGLRFCPVKDR